MFWSIISDYDLRTGICELIDNAFDLWVANKRRRDLMISVQLDVQRQLISVEDNAGGVAEANLRLLVALGGSSNSPQGEVIGVFGVGSKRAAVALGEQVEIRTRYGKGGSFQIDITKEWIESGEWEIPSYSISNVAPYTTRVDISRLRRSFTDADVLDLAKHLAETYSWFIDQGCKLQINGKPLKSVHFDSWAYPVSFPPQRANFSSELFGVGKVAITVVGGLILDRDPEAENYGVYFYCNHRLIVKELRVRDVGYYVTREAGVPHPDASLARVIVHLNGPARAMPWNSSKSAINYAHPVFLDLRPTVIQLNSYFSSLSRRLKHSWPKDVYSKTTGEIQEIEPAKPDEKSSRLVLPDLPRVNKSTLERLKEKNRKTVNASPWTLGLLEGMGVVDVLTRQKLQTKNRFALIILDSNFEIALKEFIVHQTDLFPAKKYNQAYLAELFQDRPRVIREINAVFPLPPEFVTRAQHYYLMRNKLIHERATVDVASADIENYQRVVEGMLRHLFGLKFGK